MCVNCDYCHTPARLVTGEEIYEHLPELYYKNFWLCDQCGAYVGCHDPNPKFGFDGTQPLGRLANAELRKAKSAAHKVFDPMWRGAGMSRKQGYAWLGKVLGLPPEKSHIGMLDVEQCNALVKHVSEYHRAEAAKRFNMDKRNMKRKERHV